MANTKGNLKNLHNNKIANWLMKQKQMEQEEDDEQGH